MKRSILATAIALSAFSMPTMAAAVEVVTEPDTIQAELRENHRGTKVTAAYAACGATFAVGYDPLARYIAVIQRGGRYTTTIWAHDIGDLNGTLSSFGFPTLTEDQIVMFVEAQTTYICK